MFKTNDEFDAVISENWEDPIFDGITDMSLYNSSDPKILWILNEPNRSQQVKNNILNHRDFHNGSIIKFKNWQKTYKKIIYVSYGLLYRCFYWDDLPNIDESAEINKINILKNIAIIYINKSKASSVSSKESIDKEYIDKKIVIQKQIDEINPSIIINASNCYLIFEDLTKDNVIIRIPGDLKSKVCPTPNRLILDYSHPADRPVVKTEEEYCDNIFKVTKPCLTELEEEESQYSNIKVEVFKPSQFAIEDIHFVFKLMAKSGIVDADGFFCFDD